MSAFAAGTADDEYTQEKFHYNISFMSQRLEKLLNLWKALFSDYSFPAIYKIIGYIIAAVLGMLCMHGYHILHEQISNLKS